MEKPQFKVGDKVIFQMRHTNKRRTTGKYYVCEIILVTNRQAFPYHLKIEGKGVNNLARESELTLWTPLNEALL
jgi:hypothetical protein